MHMNGTNIIPSPDLITGIAIGVESIFTLDYRQNRPAKDVNELKSIMKNLHVPLDGHLQLTSRAMMMGVLEAVHIERKDAGEDEGEPTGGYPSQKAGPEADIRPDSLVAKGAENVH